MKIKVLMLKDVAWVWWKWELKEVSDTYARNVLIKQSAAKIADKKTIKDHEKKMKNKKQENEKIKENKENAIEWIKENGLKIYVPSSASGNLYEKIDIKHIRQEIVSSYWVQFEDKELNFPDKKVNKTWTYDFSIKHNWKKISLKLKVLTK